MKKRVLALLLGGVLAVGGLFVHGSLTAQAAEYLGTAGWEAWKTEKNCLGYSDVHITSSAIIPGDGQFKVTLAVSYASENNEELIDAACGGAVYVCEQAWTPAAGVGDGNTYYDFEEWNSNAKEKKYFIDGVEINGITEIVFDGLNNGQTYYVYYYVYDVHGEYQAFYGEHYAVCLGEVTPTDGSEDLTVPAEETPVAETPTAETPVAETPVAETPAAETPAAGTVYVVRSGDTMWGIAKANHMTLEELAAKNPQIRDLSKIWGSQQINL